MKREFFVLELLPPGATEWQATNVWEWEEKDVALLMPGYDSHGPTGGSLPGPPARIVRYVPADVVHGSIEAPDPTSNPSTQEFFLYREDGKLMARTKDGTVAQLAVRDEIPDGTITGGDAQRARGKW